MKKALKIGIPLLLLAAAIVCAGLFLFGNERTPETGRILIANNGKYLFIDKNNSPIALQTQKADAFKGIANGDRVFVLHGLVMESYPAQTRLYAIGRLGSSDEAFDETLMESLTSLGWIGEEKAEKTAQAVCAAGYAHLPAETEKTVPEPIYATCGNTQCELTYGAVRYSFMFDESVTLHNLLLNLVYDEPICGCGTEFSVTPEFSETYGVNLSKYFVRSQNGQCSLTETQAEKIRQAVENVVSGKTQSSAASADPLSAFSGAEIDAATAAQAAGKFSLNFFKKVLEKADGKNVLISPLSLYTALSLTANAAGGETRAQFSSLLGVDDPEGLSLFLQNYAASLTSGSGFSLANAIWANEGKIELNRDFVHTAKTYFGAEITCAPFTEETLKNINDWGMEQTDGMIDGILSSLDPNALMVLINALAFQSDWQKGYAGTDLAEGYFTAADRQKEKVTYMYGSEGEYFEVPGGRGFVKYYKNPRFRFIAILPDEGLTPEEMTAALSPSSLFGGIENSTYCKVDTSLPRFGFEYGNDVSSTLKALGLTDAFDPITADLSFLGTGKTGENLQIEKVIHKTRIDVTPKGTSAAAVTAEVVSGASLQTETKEVFLTRPFLFMIVDAELNFPVFMGVLNSVND